jgi:hypothetical protein
MLLKGFHKPQIKIESRKYIVISFFSYHLLQECLRLHAQLFATALVQINGIFVAIF